MVSQASLNVALPQGSLGPQRSALPSRQLVSQEQTFQETQVDAALLVPEPQFTNNEH